MHKNILLSFILFLLSTSLIASEVIGIDVRTWLERKINSADGSLHIPTGDLKEELENKKVLKDQPIVVFCESGGRSARAKKVLEELGYTNVKNIGTWREWNKDYQEKK